MAQFGSCARVSCACAYARIGVQKNSGHRDPAGFSETQSRRLRSRSCVTFESLLTSVVCATAHMSDDAEMLPDTCGLLVRARGLAPTAPPTGERVSITICHDRSGIQARAQQPVRTPSALSTPRALRSRLCAECRAGRISTLRIWLIPAPPLAPPSGGAGQHCSAAHLSTGPPGKSQAGSALLRYWSAP